MPATLGGKQVEVDRELKPLLEELDRSGYHTVYSDAGAEGTDPADLERRASRGLHRDSGYIAFEGPDEAKRLADSVGLKYSTAHADASGEIGGITPEAWDADGPIVESTASGHSVLRVNSAGLHQIHAALMRQRVDSPPGAPSEPKITIEHSGDGTVVHGTERGDTATTAALKDQGFKWSRNLDGWYLPRTWGVATREQRVNALASKLGNKVTVVRGDLAKSGTAAEQAQARIDRATEIAETQTARAARLSAESDARIARAREIGSHIPFGQPILVGHHSEGRHRSDLAKIDAGYRAGFAAQDESDAATRRAESATAAARAVTDPKAAARRLDRNEAELRKVQRSIAASPADHPHTATLRAMQTDLMAKIEHDRSIVGEGGNGLSKDNVLPGDIVKVGSRHHIVTSTGPKNVKVLTGVGHLPYPYHQLSGHLSGDTVKPETVEKLISNERAPQKYADEARAANEKRRKIVESGVDNGVPSASSEPPLLPASAQQFVAESRRVAQPDKDFRDRLPGYEKALTDTAVERYGADPEEAKQAASDLSKAWSKWAETGHRGNSFGNRDAGDVARRIQKLASGSAPADDFDKVILAQRDISQATIDSPTLGVGRVDHGVRAHAIANGDKPNEVPTDTAQSWATEEHIPAIQSFWKGAPGGGGNQTRVTLHDQIPKSSIWATAATVPHLSDPKLMAPGEVVVAHGDKLATDAATVSDVVKPKALKIASKLIKDNPDVSARALSAVAGSELRFKVGENTAPLVDLARKIDPNDPSIGQIGTVLKDVVSGYTSGIAEDRRDWAGPYDIASSAQKQWAEDKIVLKRAGLSYADVEDAAEKINGKRPDLSKWDANLANQVEMERMARTVGKSGSRADIEAEYRKRGIDNGS